MILTESNLKKANILAQKSFDKWDKISKNGSGTYRHNRIDGCLIGTKCEVAIQQFLLENNLLAKPTFFDLDSPHDLIINDRIIESKGLRESHWDKFKRCVPPKQLEKYVRKNAIVIWGTATVDSKDPKVQLRGWNFAKEIKEKGIYRKTICDNIWLEKDSDMRDMNALVTKLMV